MKIGFFWICFFLFIAEVNAQRQSDFSRHEIRLGIGILPFAPGIDEYDDIFGNEEDYRGKILDLTDRRYRGNLYTTGDFSLSYGYYFWKWFQVGVDVSYTRFWRRYSEGKESSTYTTLIPFIHFHWFNRSMVSMYSGAGIGWDFVRQKDTGLSKNERETEVGLQFTFYGISVGRRLFGFAEAGIGNLGILRWGIGYRF